MWIIILALLFIICYLAIMNTDHRLEVKHLEAQKAELEANSRKQFNELQNLRDENDALCGTHHRKKESLQQLEESS